MLKLSKEKDCEILSDWIKSCTNHLHWSATTTSSGDGDLILAKFNVFLSRILNKHANLDNPLFAVAAGTQNKIVLGKQDFVSKANKLLPQTNWGMGGAASPPLGSRGKAPGKL